MELANETESFKCAMHTSFLAIPWKNSFKVQKLCSVFLDYLPQESRSASYIHKYPLLLVMTSTETQHGIQDEVSPDYENTRKQL